MDYIHTYMKVSTQISNAVGLVYSVTLYLGGGGGRRAAEKNRNHSCYF